MRSLGRDARGGLTPSVARCHMRKMSIVKRICVYCGSNQGHDPRFAVAARRFGEVLAANRIGLVYGGGTAAVDEADPIGGKDFAEAPGGDGEARVMSLIRPAIHADSLDNAHFPHVAPGDAWRQAATCIAAERSHLAAAFTSPRKGKWGEGASRGAIPTRFALCMLVICCAAGAARAWPMRETHGDFVRE